MERQDTQQSRLPKLMECTLDERKKLFAMWMLNFRGKDMKVLDVLFDMDDLWNSVYEENRISGGFMQAEMLANKAVLDEVFKIEDK